MSDISFGDGTATDVLEGLHTSADALRAGMFVGDASDQDLILLARFNGFVVGFLAATTEPLGAVVVWEHLVAPEFRDRGIGRRLLLEAARRTPPMSRLIIDPKGDFAIEQVSAYYSRLGFPLESDDRFRISVRAHEVVDAVGEQLEEETNLEAILRRKPSGVVTLDPDASVAEALALLTDMKVGSVVVSRDGETIEGILSEREIVVGLHHHGAAMLDSQVREFMSTDFTTAEASDMIADVMEVATTRRLRHLPVTSDGKLVGIVSVGDLLIFRMREHDMRRDSLPFRTRS